MNKLLKFTFYFLGIGLYWGIEIAWRMSALPFWPGKWELDAKLKPLPQIW
jgi:hypothetical protein